MKILFVEDNPDLREEISFQLGRLGHEVECLDCGEALLERIGGEPTPSILILDLGLPDIDGIDLARAIRISHPGLPIVMLTARGAVEQRIEGWSAGADAYMTKPVHLKELCVVLESLVERHATVRSVSAGGWILDLQQNRLVNPQGDGCALSFAECALLNALIRAKGEPVERDVLVKALGEQFWTYDMRRLETAISRLRKKIKELGDEQDLLRPVRGIGYLIAGHIGLRD